MNLRWRIAQFFEIRWWQRYLGKYDKSAYLDWKRHYWQSFLEKSGLVVPPNAVVLDVGCGPAGIFMVLDTQTVDALDPLLARYEKKLSHFRRADYPRVRFFDAPLETFFPNRKYDFVFCLNALNHVADLPRCLERLAALVKPNGIIALSIDAHHRAWLKHLFRLVPADVLHPHQYDLAEYRAMLERQGFTIKQTLLVKKGLVFDYQLLVAENS
ncbi:MAG: class I SAM-dependent methyltransferase [Saprospiraceae bacterium]|nr:class I SAM-dependent methyltransferase [Saprospiraceae bacterium]